MIIEEVLPFLAEINCQDVDIIMSITGMILSGVSITGHRALIHRWDEAQLGPRVNLT